MAWKKPMMIIRTAAKAVQPTAHPLTSCCDVIASPLSSWRFIIARDPGGSHHQKGDVAGMGAADLDAFTSQDEASGMTR
jgi:nitroreductase